jgi:hypothetical protein
LPGILCLLDAFLSGFQGKRSVISFCFTESVRRISELLSDISSPAVFKELCEKLWKQARIATIVSKCLGSFIGDNYQPY